MGTITREALGLRIRWHREDQGLLQRELAEAAGVPETSISHYENGDRYPNAENLYRIAHVLDIADYILQPFGANGHATEHEQ